MRIGKTQAAIIGVMKARGGEHVSVGAGMHVFGTPLEGYTAEEVERSLSALVRRGLVIEVKRGFYTLPKEPNHAD